MFLWIIVDAIKKGIVNAVEDVLRKFSFWICRMIYPLIASFYDIFDILARHRFFTDESIRQVSNNTYIIVSVIMLFAFSIKLLNSIVNPEVLSDKKKGFAGVLMRSFIGILLIILIPWGFQIAYELQDKILDKSVIQKIILGSKTVHATDGGNVIAGTTLSTFLQKHETEYNKEAVADKDNGLEPAIQSYDSNAFDNTELNSIGEIGGGDANYCPAGLTIGDAKKYQNEIDGSYSDLQIVYNREMSMHDYLETLSEDEKNRAIQCMDYYNTYLAEEYASTTTEPAKQKDSYTDFEAGYVIAYSFSTTTYDDIDMNAVIPQTCPAGLTFKIAKDSVEYINSADDSKIPPSLQSYLGTVDDDAKMIAMTCLTKYAQVYNKYSTEEVTDTLSLVVFDNFSGACDVKYDAIIADISKIDDFKKCILDRDGNDDYRWNFNGIIAPIAGIVMVYEMLLLCIDIALRSIKLGLLQLIAPIIICGYIYSGEILSKWVKEVVATYVLVFVKLATVSLLVFGLTLLDSFSSNSDFKNHSGWIKIFIIIGLLQLVKQVPTLINTIFGTNIKLGGIKDRLGEMAGVGKMAQDAWSKIGAKAKGLRNTLALAPLGAAGAGLKKGFNKLANSNTKGGIVADKIKKTTTQMKNGRTGRLLKTFAAGVNSNGKGTAKALKETWNKNPITQSQLSNERNERSSRRNKYNNMNDAGTATVFNNAGVKYGIDLNNPFDASSVKFTDKDGQQKTFADIKKMKKRDGESDNEFISRRNEALKRYNEAVVKARIEYDSSKVKQLTADIDGVVKNVKNNSGISKDGRKYFDNFTSATSSKENIDAAKANQDKMISILESAKNNTMDAQTRTNLEELIGSVKSNGFYSKSVEDQINDFKDYKSLIGDKTFDKLAEATIKFNSQTEGLSAKGASAIAAEVTTRTKELENSKKVLDDYKNAITDEKTKSEIDEYENMITVKTKELINSRADSVYFGYDKVRDENNNIVDSLSYGQRVISKKDGDLPDFERETQGPTLQQRIDESFDIHDGPTNGVGDIDTDAIATKVAEKLANNINNDDIATQVASQLSNNMNNQTTSDITDPVNISGDSINEIKKAVSETIKSNSSDTNSVDTDTITESFDKSIKDITKRIDDDNISLNNNIENLNNNVSDSTSKIRKDIKDSKETIIEEIEKLDDSDE